MIPLVSQVYTAARGVLGDTQTAAGEVYVDAILQPFLKYSYAEFFRANQASQNPRVRQETYWNVPAYTGYVDPATMGIENLGEIETIEERGGVTAWAISGVSPGSGIATVTSAATTLALGNQAVVYGVVGISDDINGIWTVTPNSTTSTQLNGCAAVGTYVSGGVLSYSTEIFYEVMPQQRITWVEKNPQTTFRVYAWERDILRFPPASDVRQIRVVYSLSGNAPTTTTASIGIDDSLSFFMYRMAGLAAQSKGMLTRAALYNAMAVGPKWDSAGVAGGILAQLLESGVRNLQRLPPAQRQPPPYRARRRYFAW